jgi:hypothetical protein
VPIAHLSWYINIVTCTFGVEIISFQPPHPCSVFRLLLGFASGVYAHPATCPVGAGVKWPVCEVDRLPLSTDEIEKVELHLYAPCVPLRHTQGQLLCVVKYNKPYVSLICVAPCIFVIITFITNKCTLFIL